MLSRVIFYLKSVHFLFLFSIDKLQSYGFDYHSIMIEKCNFVYEHTYKMISVGRGLIPERPFISRFCFLCCVSEVAIRCN